MFTDVIFGRTTAIPDWELLTLSGLQRFHDFCGSEQELSPDLLAACRSALSSIASNDEQFAPAPAGRGRGLASVEAVLLAEELALIAIDPESGRHQLGIRSDLNACLAGLLVAELLLDGSAAPGPKQKTVVPAGAAPPDQPVLRAVAGIVADKGPKMKAILSHIDRGLDAELGSGTWDTMMGGLEAAGILGPSSGGLRPRRELRTPEARNGLLQRLQTAAAGDGPLDRRTALVLSMTGPAQLLEEVAPGRSARKHARNRIDHTLDDTDLESIGDTVRALRAEAAAIAATAATGAVIGGSS